MQARNTRAAPETHKFSDDGSIPNNPILSFVVFRNAIDLRGSPDHEAVIEKTFLRHGWVGTWRNGVYPYVHYHSRIHEVMGIARGRARVQFGGEHGAEIDLKVGDVVVLPAGTGHQRLWQTPDLVVVGAYPPSGRFDLCRGTPAEHDRAVAAIREVPLPTTCPVRGKAGPLVKLWTAEAEAAAHLSTAEATSQGEPGRDEDAA
ncbi:Cupin domain-containing protein [Rhodovulum sp. PH10]|uniref:cupin domain-containing protein n=1 Tax=Rhodovulum sp. PH10 TaxID=1187851 RepID=UPI00027C2C6B|nr:cupin domain-containing protein [Rhodovulum sp. PH10]EJW10587.1 Cupin domain-containing protein [Rhodovulum sp. PH10]